MQIWCLSFRGMNTCETLCGYFVILRLGLLLQCIIFEKQNYFLTRIQYCFVNLVYKENNTHIILILKALDTLMIYLTEIPVINLVPVYWMEGEISNSVKNK